jgi:hypothetical protein
VLPPSPLQALGDDIWLVEGPTVRFLGFPYPTRMAVIRLPNGDLWIWSPIALTPELERAVNQYGLVRYLVAPNKLHHLYLGDWKRTWPRAKLYAPPGLAKRRRDLDFDHQLMDTANPEWGDEIDQVIFRGSFAMDEVVFFHRASSTVIFTDLIQKFDPATLSGWRRVLMTLDGMVGPEGSTPREWRLSFWNRRAARRAAATVMAWEPRRLVFAHGRCVLEGGTEAVRVSLRWLGA